MNQVLDLTKSLNTGYVVRARAPLRLGLAGGGTDVSPYCDQFGGAVLNATINLHATATLYENNENIVRFVATDIEKSEEHQCRDGYNVTQGLQLHRAVYSHFVKNYNNGIPIPLTVITNVDAPPGSGLGSSSALVVAMVQAFDEYFSSRKTEYEIARIAHHIERNDARLNGGRQDQYAATFGGVNFMEFGNNESVLVNPLRVKPRILHELEESIVTVFSGVSRDSAAIIDRQTDAIKTSSKSPLDAMHQLKAEAVNMKESLLRGDLREVASIIHRSWEAKKRTSTAISNELIEKIIKTGARHGAVAAKVSGAGGGGFIMFIVEPSNKKTLARALASAGYVVQPCQFTESGAKAWRTTPFARTHLLTQAV